MVRAAQRQARAAFPGERAAGRDVSKLEVEPFEIVIGVDGWDRLVRLTA